eukprot:3262897-Rhodomonas_salina.1
MCNPKHAPGQRWKPLALCQSKIKSWLSNVQVAQLHLEHQQRQQQALTCRRVETFGAKQA